MANLLDKASIILTPTASDNGKVLCVKPSTSPYGDFDFFRNTAATRVNAQGLIEDEGSDLPRINYSGFSYDGSGNVIPNSGCGAWLFEPQSTNLITYSEDFSKWIAGGSTTIQSGYLAPDGTNSAYKVSGAGSALSLAAGLTATTTRSIYARTVSGTGQANLCSYNSNTNNLFTITEEWQRFDVNSANATGVTTFYAVDFRGGTTLSEIILWGANATNDQDYATSYVPSNGESVTRNQDVCNKGGDAGNFNSRGGTLFVEAAALANLDSVVNRDITVRGGVESENWVKLTFNTNQKIEYEVYRNGVLIFNEEVTPPASMTSFLKIAIIYGRDNFALWINGVSVDTKTNGPTPAGLEELDFSADGDITNSFYGKTKQILYFPEVLSNTELAALTSWTSFTAMANSLNYNII